MGLPHKLDFIPVLDVRTGFPFSKLDENWNYTWKGERGRAFPNFRRLDMKIQYPFDFQFHGRRFQFRAGLSVLNVLNYSNPRGVYNSIGWNANGTEAVSSPCYDCRV